MIVEIARTPDTADIPISGIGGITDWRDAVDHLALGAQNVQVCTAAMVYGFKIIDDLADGLSNFLDEKGMTRVSDLVGKAVPSVTDWQYLNLNHVEKAHIDQDLCISCGRCHVVGAPVLDDFLGTTLKAWLKERTRIIRRWIREGKINAVDPQALLYMIWAITQHYADFERQIIILNNGKELSDRSYKQRTEQVVNLVLASVGAFPAS